MKLSQIKKIIKESIKGLMNEQTVSGYKRVEGIICNHPIPAVIGTLTNFEVGAAMGGLVYCNGVPCTPSNVGETLGLGNSVITVTDVITPGVCSNTGGNCGMFDLTTMSCSGSGGQYNEITLVPCPNNTSTGGINTIIYASMTIGGNTPTVGMVANLDNNPLSTMTGDWEVTTVNQTSQTCTHPSNVGGICNFDVGDCGGGSVSGCTDSIATNYDPTATVDDGSCIYDPTDCIKANWLGHINTNFPQINDPSTTLQLAHFCEYCIDGTIPPMTDSFCKCCDPIEPCQPPIGGCTPPMIWNQAACKCKRGPGPIREEVERLKKLANIKI